MAGLHGHNVVPTGSFFADHRPSVSLQCLCVTRVTKVQPPCDGFSRATEKLSRTTTRTGPGASSLLSNDPWRSKHHTSAPRIYAWHLVSNHICLSRLTRASNHCPGQPAASSKYLFATDRPPTALFAHRPSPVLSWLTLSLCAHHPRTDLADIEPSHLRVYPDIQRMSASGDPHP